MEATMEHVKGQEHSQSQMVHWRIFIFSVILALTGLFCTLQLDAEIYKWVDEKGVIHYGNILPANTGNVKIVSREYQHDEAADQKRVKTDQKKIDALTGKIKKGEQQAKAAEEAKVAEDTKADTSCYLKAAVDVRVIVWPVDKSGNKGEKIWEGVIKKGERKLIRTLHGKIRYAGARNLDEDQYTSGEKSRWCDSLKEIGVP